MRRALVRLPALIQAQNAASSRHIRCIANEEGGLGSMSCWQGHVGYNSCSHDGVQTRPNRFSNDRTELHWAGPKLSYSGQSGCMTFCLTRLALYRGFSALAQDNTGGKDRPAEEGSAAAQHHQSHQPATAKQESSSGSLSGDVVYQGPLSSTHKLLKRISLANTFIALCAAPVIIEYADISYASRVGLAASLVFFGIITTGALHWITHPYIHELKYNAATGMIDVRMANFFGGSRHEQFHVSDVHPLPWNRPVATFMANNKYYYVDVYSFPDEALLHKLTPDPDTVPPGYKDDKDDD